MPTKLEDLRKTLNGKPTHYPTAYHLAILDGCYDTAQIEKAMMNDINQFVIQKTSHPTTRLKMQDHQPKPTLPFDYELDEAIRLEAERKGHILARAPGLSSANKAIAYIQSCGRNSLQSQALVSALQPRH